MTTGMGSTIRHVCGECGVCGVCVTQDVKRNTLVHVLGSPRLLMGTGYAIYLLNSPGEAYVLDPTGTKPFVLSGTVLDWLREMKANWLVAGEAGST